MVLARDLVKREQRDLNWHRSKGQIHDAHFNGVPVLKFTDTEHTGFYYKTKTHKQGICLHYTEGYLGGDISHLSRQDVHVSVPFIIGQSGHIVQMFDPDYWAYHLGRGAIGGNKRGSSSVIGIELNSVGHLSQSGNWMFTYWGNEYCRVSETQYYQTLSTPYRGERHFATFTEAQYDSLNLLLDALLSSYSIPRNFVPWSKRFEPFSSASQASNYRGISSHVNFRSSGKRDIGPAFNWSRIGA